VSWAAHDLEPYAIQRHLGIKVAFVPPLVGSYAPDLMTKWFVYGVELFGYELKADDPVQFHRDWPGAGFTHSLLFGVVIGFLLWRLTGSRIWGLSFMIGQWAHSITDVGDTVGAMLLFPWTYHFHVDAWAYAGQYGPFVDAGAYFSGLGFVWDGVWVVYAELAGGHTRVLSADDRPHRPLLALGRTLGLRDGPPHLLPRGVLLRDVPLDRLAHLGARRERLPLRPELGRPALGRRRDP